MKLSDCDVERRIFNLYFLDSPIINTFSYATQQENLVSYLRGRMVAPSSRLSLIPRQLHLEPLPTPICRFTPPARLPPQTGLSFCPIPTRSISGVDCLHDEHSHVIHIPTLRPVQIPQLASNRRSAFKRQGHLPQHQAADHRLRSRAATGRLRRRKPHQTNLAVTHRLRPRYGGCMRIVEVWTLKTGRLNPPRPLGVRAQRMGRKTLAGAGQPRADAHGRLERTAAY